MMLTYYFVGTLRGIMKTKFLSWAFQKKTGKTLTLPFEHLNLRFTVQKKTKLIVILGLPLMLHNYTVLKQLLIYLLLKQYVPIVTDNARDEDISIDNWQ